MPPRKRNILEQENTDPTEQETVAKKRKVQFAARTTATSLGRADAAAATKAKGRPQRTTVLHRQQVAENEMLRKSNKQKERENRRLVKALKESQQVTNATVHDNDSDGGNDSQGPESEDDVSQFSSSFTALPTHSSSTRGMNEFDPAPLRRLSRTKAQAPCPVRLHKFVKSPTPSREDPRPPSTILSEPVIPDTSTHPVPSTTATQTTSQTATATSVENTTAREPKLKSNIAGRPKIGHYESPDNAIIQAACKAFEARVIANGGFPDPAQSLSWTEESWQKACMSAGEDIRLADPIRTIIRSKSSHVRNELLQCVRHVIASAYDFEEDITKAAEKHNKQLYLHLKQNFPFKDQDEASPVQYMEASIFPLVLRDWGFSKDHKPAAIYKSLFDPVSVPTLALFKLMIDYCLEEWASGKHVKGPEFKEKNYVEDYEAHLADVKAWAATVEDITTKIRGKIYKRARGSQEQNKTTVSSQHQ